MLLTNDFDKALQTHFEKLHLHIDRSRLLKDTEALWRAEFGQTFDCYHASAKVAEGLLKGTGCEQIERIAFPADGKTVFQDKTMPLGWRASIGKLEVIESVPRFEEPVVADFKRHPFHLIKGSVATPPGGVEARLINEEDVKAGVDPRGAMVLLDPQTPASYRNLKDAGILGIVSDYLVGRHDTPTALQWANACTESHSWHTRADEGPHIGFVVSPVVGDQLRSALRQGEVRVRVTSDGERREDIIEAVTGVLPGEDAREIWLLAHLYEPLSSDNSSGVACALEIARVLQTLWKNESLPSPRFTLRLVFAMECYGFAAFAERFGGRLRDKVLCAMNVDALPIQHGKRRVKLNLSQSGSPSCADYVLQALMSSQAVHDMEVTMIEKEGLYTDDRLMGDSTVGVPTLWVQHARKRSILGEPNSEPFIWHNSTQDMSFIDREAFHAITAVYSTWAAAMLGLKRENLEGVLACSLKIARARLEAEQKMVLKMLEDCNVRERSAELADWLDYRLEIESARLEDLSRFVGTSTEVKAAVAELSELTRKLKAEVAAALADLPVSKISQDNQWQLAQLITITRKTRGLPRDFAAAPKDLRSDPLTAPVMLALVHANGRRTAAELFQRAQWELRNLFSPEQVLSYIASLEYLSKYGYIDLKKP